MMENNSVASPLVGSEIHGFHTMADLDVVNMMEEAKSRWLRPNEIHAVLCNHKYFIVNVKPKNLPKSGTVVLFDRKMLRNFRKDGYNWKKKNDGKTVKEAHEHLKVGNDERIHVYYAHGEDNPTFVRRCYWLLDKSLENIVLVHYRETRELQGSPSTSGNSNSGSGLSELPGSWPLSQEFESALDKSFYTGGRQPLGRQDSLTTKNHALTLHEINTLDWDDLLVPDGYQKQIIPQGKTECFEQPNQYGMISYEIGDNGSSRNVCTENTNGGVFSELPDVRNAISYNTANDLSSLITNAVVQSHGEDSSRNLCQNGLQSQDSFGKWMSNIIADSPGSADDQTLETSNLNENQSLTSLVMDNHHPHALNEVFNITDVSPAWALSTEETKILVVGFFNEGQQPIGKSKFYLSCGDSILPVEIVQTGVFRSLIPPQTPGLVNLYMTFDGHTPISQVLSFQFRAPALPSGTVSLQKEPTREEFQLQMRLAHLLFTSSKLLTIFSSKLSQNALKEAEAFAKKTSHITNGWMRLNKMIRGTNTASPLPKESLFEVILQNRLREWLLEEVIVGCQKAERDAQGQGVIHLCAILGYTWAIYPYSCSGLSLDYRDKSGWTALHWAAYYGREKMVAVLLSAGAKPNLVTDPTSESPGGCTAADLASKNGYDGLAAYLAEKGLVAQFNDMTLAGNVSGSLQTTGNDTINMGDFSEEESYLKDTLTAYRTAADAAARIQASFREHSFKVRKKAIESSSPETEARNIIAAMKIQHAFRNYETRKKIQAAARIQNGFRTWKIRKNFLNTRRQVIKIQAYFRAYQARKQYRKIIWSVGVLEKAILRWRQRGKGFRGLQVEPSEDFMEDPNQESDAEEDFFQASRKQAEDRVERSVVRVQAMFRSRRAQEEYRRMKLEHNQATLDYEELRHPDIDMGRGNS